MYAVIAVGDGKSILYLLQRYINERSEFRSRWVGALIEAKIPLIYLCGPADSISGRSVAERFKELIPDQFQTYFPEEVGHWPHIEAPNLVTKEYFKFLAIQTLKSSTSQ